MKELPCAECKGRCCTYPNFSPSEFKAIVSLKGLPAGAEVTEMLMVQSYDPKQNNTVIVAANMPNGKCPWLATDGKCSVYYLRPKTCRDYGMVAELPCEYLYPDEAKAKADARVAKTPGARLEPMGHLLARARR